MAASRDAQANRQLMPSIQRSERSDMYANQLRKFRIKCKTLRSRLERIHQETVDKVRQNPDDQRLAAAVQTCNQYLDNFDKDVAGLVGQLEHDVAAAKMIRFYWRSHAGIKSLSELYSSDELKSSLRGANPNECLRNKSATGPPPIGIDFERLQPSRCETNEAKLRTNEFYALIKADIFAEMRRKYKELSAVCENFLTVDALEEQFATQMRTDLTMAEDDAERACVVQKQLVSLMRKLADNKLADIRPEQLRDLRATDVVGKLQRVKDTPFVRNVVMGQAGSPADAATLDSTFSDRSANESTTTWLYFTLNGFDAMAMHIEDKDEFGERSKRTVDGMFNSTESPTSQNPPPQRSDRSNAARNRSPVESLLDDEEEPSSSPSSESSSSQTSPACSILDDESEPSYPSTASTTPQKALSRSVLDDESESSAVLEFQRFLADRCPCPLISAADLDSVSQASSEQHFHRYLIDRCQPDVDWSVSAPPVVVDSSSKASSPAPGSLDTLETGTRSMKTPKRGEPGYMSDMSELERHFWTEMGQRVRSPSSAGSPKTPKRGEPGYVSDMSESERHFWTEMGQRVRPPSSDGSYDPSDESHDSNLSLSPIEAASPPRRQRRNRIEAVDPNAVHSHTPRRKDRWLEKRRRALPLDDPEPSKTPQRSLAAADSLGEVASAIKGSTKTAKRGEPGYMSDMSESERHFWTEMGQRVRPSSLASSPKMPKRGEPGYMSDMSESERHFWTEMGQRVRPSSSAGSPKTPKRGEPGYMSDMSESERHFWTEMGQRVRPPSSRGSYDSSDESHDSNMSLSPIEAASSPRRQRRNRIEAVDANAVHSHTPRRKDRWLEKRRRALPLDDPEPSEVDSCGSDEASAYRTAIEGSPKSVKPPKVFQRALALHGKYIAIRDQLGGPAAVIAMCEQQLKRKSSRQDDRPKKSVSHENAPATGELMRRVEHVLGKFERLFRPQQSPARPKRQRHNASDAGQRPQNRSASEPWRGTRVSI